MSLRALLAFVRWYLRELTDLQAAGHECVQPGSRCC